MHSFVTHVLDRIAVNIVETYNIFAQLL